MEPHCSPPMDAPAAGQYRRINVPQKGRPPSPPPAQLPGCVAGRFSNPGGAGALEWHLANGAPVRRRLRSSSPKAREGDLADLGVKLPRRG